MFRLPVKVEEPVIIEEPVNIRVSTLDKVELPETISDPLIIRPLDAVTDAKCASLPLTITLFQVANYYSILLHRVHISIHINMNLGLFWSNYNPNLDFCES